jgi:hypothetical protein
MKKNFKILVICPPELNDVARDNGADYFGYQDYFDKIKSGWIDFDLILTTPDLWPKFGQLGKFLAPLELMPDNKSGFVTNDIAKPLKQLKQIINCDHTVVICKKCLKKGCNFSNCQNEIYRWNDGSFDHHNGCKGCGSKDAFIVIED